MEKGAADSMSIAAMLIYTLDISGERSSCVSALMRRMRKQIIAVRMMFRLTLSEAHGTASWIGFPFNKDMSGRAHSTSVMIEVTAKKDREKSQYPRQ
jgi:hypothetical protein